MLIISRGREILSGHFFITSIYVGHVKCQIESQPIDESARVGRKTVHSLTHIIVDKIILQVKCNSQNKSQGETDKNKTIQRQSDPLFFFIIGLTILCENFGPKYLILTSYQELICVTRNKRFNLTCVTFKCNLWKLAKMHIRVYIYIIS